MGDGLSKAFEVLTGHAPFPWQRALYEEWFVNGKFPSSCNLPTGLGKTNVIAVWLIALFHHPDKMPRRLVYVVNRRTVVDQTTDEVIKLHENLPKLEDLPEQARKLAISTLRGQFADNREWSADPSRPAVICGTVDMIGSRLLFSGYGVGFKAKPLHAGFLGQDVLLVHDEAHLEPAFQELIETIEKEQCRERRTSGDLPWPKLRVMQLTATTRSKVGQTESQDQQKDEKPFGLTEDENNPPDKIPDPTEDEPPIYTVWRRLKAQKTLYFSPVEDGKQTAGKISKIAAGYKDANAAVLIFARTLEAVATVEKELRKTTRAVVLLTGTMRGKERDDLVKTDEFKRFLKGADSGETVYLVCTSAGEVGIDISADHLVCDLSTFDSIAQRFGRVNRYGEPVEHVARIDVVHPTSFGKMDKKTGELKADEVDKRRQNTLDLLKKLPAIGNNQHDASPLALSELDAEERLAAFAPDPIILPATDILFDAWALTTIRGKLPGRPPVAPYLHGIADWQPPQTQIAWRQEVEVIDTDELRERYRPADLLDVYPLKPRELLNDRSDRVFKHLEVLAERHGGEPVWLLDDREAVEVTTLEKLADKQHRDRINGCTILLPPSSGGLAGGLLDGTSQFADDVADIPSSQTDARVRVWLDDADYKDKTAKMRRVQTIEIDVSSDDEEPRRWEWFERIPQEGGRTARKPVTLDTHVGDVVECAKRIVAGLSLPQEIADAVILAAELHDHGKRRERFQTTLGNREYPQVVLAKSGRKGARVPEPFRHEFASLHDAQADSKCGMLTDEMKDLVLHLIAAHHGRARPHFPPDEAFDPDWPLSGAEAMAIETPRRFARLQRKYGRWGLAYVESLLRAADWAASAAPSAYADESEAGL